MTFKGYSLKILNILSKKEINIVFSNLEINAEKIIEMESFKALCRIRGILMREEFTDTECLDYIEAIVRVFEELGSNCGSRHDW